MPIPSQDPPQDRFIFIFSLGVKLGQNEGGWHGVDTPPQSNSELYRGVINSDMELIANLYPATL